MILNHKVEVSQYQLRCQRITRPVLRTLVWLELSLFKWTDPPPVPSLGRWAAHLVIDDRPAYSSILCFVVLVNLLPCAMLLTSLQSILIQASSSV